MKTLDSFFKKQGAPASTATASAKSDSAAAPAAAPVVAASAPAAAEAAAPAAPAPAAAAVPPAAAAAEPAAPASAPVSVAPTAAGAPKKDDLFDEEEDDIPVARKPKAVAAPGSPLAGKKRAREEATKPQAAAAAASPAKSKGTGKGAASSASAAAPAASKSDAEEDEDSESVALEDEEEGSEEEAVSASVAKTKKAAAKAPASKKRKADAGPVSEADGGILADPVFYHPIKDAPWKIATDTAEDGTVSIRSAPVPYVAVATVFTAIEATTKRLAITAMLTNFFRSVIVACPEDLIPAVYLCTNSIAPAFASLELGVGDSILIKALSEATGRAAKDVKADAEDKGDLGLVAEVSRAKQRTLFFKPAAATGGAAPGSSSSGLTVRGVFAAFKGIALESGKSSQDKKVNAIKKMLVTASGPEAKYIVRSMQGKLRIGLAKQTVLVSLAQAVTLTQPVVDVTPTGVYTDSLKAFGVAVGQAKRLTAGVAMEDEEEAAEAAAAAAGGSAPSAASVAATIEGVTAHTQQAFSTLLGVPKGCTVVARGAGGGAFPPVLLDTRPASGKDAKLVGDAPASREAVAVEQRLEAAAVTLKQVYSELPSLDVIIPQLLKWGIDGARATCALTPGVPVTPMLAKPTKGVREVLTRFEGERFTCEWKYDGERAQVHRTEDGKIAIFSRNSEDTTGKYPDLGPVLQTAMGSAASASSGGVQPVTSCVLDGEVVAYDREKNCLLPFQVLSTRARKDVAVEDIKVQVIYAAFDLMYLNGKSLLHVPLAKRQELLRAHFQEVPGRFTFAQASESNDVEEINTFLSDSVKGGCEGLMVKILDGPDAVYTPSKRSLNWLKLKKDYMDGLTDSLDLVPIGAWRGKGKRTGVYGAYLLAAYDPDDETYQCITKIGTGFSDEDLASLTKVFDEKEDCIRAAKPRNVLVSDALSDADVWFDPEQSEVWEVMAADLSISPVHMAAIGKVDRAKGIALRFPRFIRRRDDKSPCDATTADQVAQMYRDQGTIQGMGGGGDDDWDM